MHVVFLLLPRDPCAGGKGEIRKGMPGLQHPCPNQPLVLQPTSLTPNSFISFWSFASFEIQLRSQHLQEALILCPPEAHNTYFRIFNRLRLILLLLFWNVSTGAVVLVIRSCLTPCDSTDCSPPVFSPTMEFSREEYWSG